MKLLALLTFSALAWGQTAILGTASFSTTGGAIVGLTVSGDVSTVTRTNAGQFAVALSTAVTGYIPMISVGDTVAAVAVQLDPVASYTPSGFTVQVIANSSTAYDPGLVFVAITGPRHHVTPPATILGTASFSASGGTIALLNVTGIVSGVTRTGTGQYAVALTGAPSNYLPFMTVGDTSYAIAAQLDPVASYSAGGFTAQVIAGSSAAYDPGTVMIVIIGN